MNWLKRFLRTNEEKLEEAKRLGMSLDMAHPKDRDDRDFVLAAIRSHGWAFRSASERLRDDKELLLEAAKRHGEELCYASARLQADREVVSKCVEKNPWALEYAANEIRNDKEFVLSHIAKSEQRGVFHGYALISSSGPDIRKICADPGNVDLVQLLRRAITIEKSHDQLQATLPQKAPAAKRGLKI